MTLREQIEQTLLEAAPVLRELSGGIRLYGAAAAVLEGVDIRCTQDIDLLVTRRDAGALCRAWADRDLHADSAPSARFRSTRSRYRFPLMDIEVCANLEVSTPDGWQRLDIGSCRPLHIGGATLCLPTLAEQRRILTLFGRPKDLERINLIDELINNQPCKN